jgi:hypothetical protein
LLTVVPGFVRYPPELAYPEHPHTDEPAIVLRESGESRMVWFPGDIERTYWLTGLVMRVLVMGEAWPQFAGAVLPRLLRQLLLSAAVFAGD